MNTQEVWIFLTTQGADFGIKLLTAIAHNGGESFRHARSTALLGVPVSRLPSTSPANASWSFDRKLTAWADLLARHGLV